MAKKREQNFYVFLIEISLFLLFNNVDVDDDVHKYNKFENTQREMFRASEILLDLKFVQFIKIYIYK